MLEKIDVTLNLFYPDAENMGKSSCRQVFCLDDGQQFSVHRAVFVFEKQNKKCVALLGTMARKYHMTFYYDNVSFGYFAFTSKPLLKL